MPPPNWSALLTCNAKGVPYTNLNNAILFIEHDPELATPTLRYNELSGAIVYATSPTRDWRDDDDVALTARIQDTTGMLRMPKAFVQDAVDLVARRRGFHPIREWLATLTWDGVERLAYAFEEYWGAEVTDQQPSEYLRAASTNFLLSLVNRVLAPGCKVDTMPVFEGPQGIQKTTALEVLGGEWFASIDTSVAEKDFLQALRGKWLVEIAELTAFTKTEWSHVKSMLSRRVDTYRPSYGRRALDVARHCVFAGTTNPGEWAVDDTGNRRFWPITCGVIRLDLLAAARPQLFAEAAQALRTGATHWQMPLTTTAVQATRHPQHVWTQPILDGLLGQTETTMLEVLVRILKLRLEEITVPQQHIAGSILRHAGWINKPARRQGKLMKVWFAPEV